MVVTVRFVQNSQPIEEARSSSGRNIRLRAGGAGSALGSASLLNLNSASGLLIAAPANGLGFAMAVSATMGISGGVLNHAVVVGLWVGRKLPSGEVLPYILAELVGAIAAGLALVVSFPPALAAQSSGARQPSAAS